MPQAAPIFIAIAKAIAVAVISGALQNSLFKKPKPGPFPLNVTVRSTVAERRLILGTTRAGGAMVFFRTSGTNSKYLWYVVAYAGHQCSALRDCWLDTVKIPAADINGVTGAVSTASFAGKLKIWDHLGTQAQTADANLTTDFAAIWLATHRLRGVCYRVFRMERSDKAFPDGAPQSFTSLIDGALTYDPRLDTTNGGAGTHRLTDPSTWAFSRNWALNVRWFLSGGSVVNDQITRLIKYGLQESDSRIDDAYVIAAANICDQSLAGANAPPSGAQVRYTCDIELSCSQTRREIIETLLMGGGPGQLVYVHGKWRIYAAAYDAPVHTFTQADLFGELEVEDTLGEEDRFNSISSVFVDAEHDWTEQTSIVRSNAAYVTQDGGQTIPREVILRCVTDQYRAQRVEELILRSARQMRVVKFRFGRQGLKVAPWETFSMTHTRYGWSARVFRCIQREEQRGDDGGVTTIITARADSSSVYTDLITADYTTGTSVTNSIQTEAPDPPTGLTATSMLRSIRFNWGLGAFWLQNGITELWEYTANTPFASATKIWEGSGRSVTIQKDDFTQRFYWVRVATVGGQTSTTEPSGNGLSGIALAGDAIVPDQEFAQATDESFWWRWQTGGGTLPTIVLTGGNYGGYAHIPANGLTSSNWIVSRRPTFSQGARGQIYTITIRARDTAGTFNGVVSASLIRHARAATNATFDPTPASGLAGYCAGGVFFQGLTTDWVEYSGLVFVPTIAGFTDGDLPAISAIVGPAAATTGSFEVDMVKVEFGATVSPIVSVFTASNNFGSTYSYLFRNCQFNHATVAGTFTLPTADANYIGARIYFEQTNAALLTIAVQGGDTLQSSPNITGSRNMAGRYARGYAEIVAANTWRIYGQLA